MIAATWMPRSAWFRVLLALAILTSVGAVWATATTERVSDDVVDVRLGRPQADRSILEDHLLWGMDLVGGAELTEAGIEARMTANFLAQVPAAQLLLEIPVLAEVRPFTYHGMRLPEEGVAQALLEGSDGTDFVLTVVVAQGNPDQMDGLAILVEPQPAGPFTPAELAAHLLGAWSLLAAAAMRLRSETSRSGSGGGLFAVAGVLWLAQLAELADSSLLYTLGLVAGPFALAALAHAVLALPTGRLHGSVRRALAATTYVAAVVAVGHLTLVDTAAVGLPRQGLLVTSWLTAGVDVQAWLYARAALGVAVALAVVVYLTQRWRRTTGLARRSMRLVISGTALVGITMLVIGGSFMSIGGFELSQSPAFSIVVVTIPLGLVVDATQSRYALGDVAEFMADLGRSPDREAWQILSPRRWAIRQSSLPTGQRSPRPM